MPLDEWSNVSELLIFLHNLILRNSVDNLFFFMMKNAFVHSRVNGITMKIDLNVNFIAEIKVIQNKIIRSKMTTH